MRPCAALENARSASSQPMARFKPTWIYCAHPFCPDETPPDIRDQLGDVG